MRKTLSHSLLITELYNQIKFPVKPPGNNTRQSTDCPLNQLKTLKLHICQVLKKFTTICTLTLLCYSKLLKSQNFFKLILKFCNTYRTAASLEAFSSQHSNRQALEVENIFLALDIGLNWFETLLPRGRC
jgi:hypothetical protein